MSINVSDDQKCAEGEPWARGLTRGVCNGPRSDPSNDRCSSLLDDGRVQAVQYELPMSFFYERKTFFVRDCYPIYYEHLVRNLEKGYRYISVSGTPGIGKSVFYMYFFQRYRRENPDATIVTASFTEERKLQACLVFYPGEEKGQIKNKIELVENAIYCYDGPPDSRPSFRNMICFSSPHYAWLESMRKEKSHTPIYLPSWTLDELHSANIRLGLGLHPSQIKARFELWGGSARLCLSTDFDEVEQSKDDLDVEVSSLKSLREILMFLTTPANRNDISHTLFHMNPIITDYPPFARFYTMHFASEFIRKKLEQHVLDVPDDEKINFIQTVKNVPESCGLAGWMMEYQCGNLFRRGGGFSCEPLSDDGKEICVDLPPNKYQNLINRKNEAVDGMYFDQKNRKLYLFQMTVNKSPSVDGNGILEIFKSLEQFGQPGQLQPHLIFVVPEDSNEFKKQRIETWDLSIGLNSNVSAIKGIGKVLASELSTIGITKVGELLDKIDNGECKEYERLMQQYVSPANEAPILKLVSQIPQYRYVLKNAISAKRSTDEGRLRSGR